MLQKSKRVIAAIACMLMCMSMLTALVLPASAAAPETDAYARIHATLQQDGTYLPGPNAIFVSQSGFGSGTFQYTYGNGDTWGDGKTYTLTFGVNAFTKLVDAVQYLNKQRTAFSGSNAQYTGPDTIVCAPGSYGGSNFQNDAVVVFNEPVDNEGTKIAQPAYEDFFRYYVLGPQAGKSPVSEDGSEKVANGRSDSTSTEAVTTGTIWHPKNAVLVVDGFAAKGSHKTYQSGSDGKLYGLEMHNIYYHCSSGTQRLYQEETTAANSALTFKNFYMTYDNVTANNANDIFYGIRLVWDNVYINRKAMDTVGDQYSQSHMFQLRPTNSDNASVGINTPDKKQALFSFTNCTFDSNPGAHMFRYKFGYKTFSGYPEDGIHIVYENNTFLDTGFDRTTNAYSGNAAITTAADTISFDSMEQGTTDIPAKALTFVFKNNLIDFTEEVMASRSSGASFFNFAAGASNTEATWDFAHNTVKHWNKRPLYYNSKNAEHIDFGDWLYIDHKGNVTTNSQYTDAAYSLTYDSAVSDEFIGGVNETFTLKGGKDMVVYGSTVDQMLTNGKIPDPNITGSIKIVPYSTAATYPAEDLFEFRGKKVEVVGLYTDASKAVELKEANPKDLNGTVLVARYKGINTVCTVTFTITVASDSDYAFVDHTNSVTSYNYNGKNFTLGSSNRYTTVSKAAASGKNVIVLLPGEYIKDTDSEANFTVGRDCCIIGPMLGINPNDASDISKPNANRGLVGTGSAATVDTAKEALFCLMVTVNGNSSELAVDGIAMGKDAELYPYNYMEYWAGKNGGQTAGLCDSTRTLGVTAKNCIVNGRDGGNAIISVQGSVSSTMKYFNSKRFGYIDNMRIEGPAGTASVISSGLNTAEITNSYFYGLNGVAFQTHVSNMDYVRIAPESTGMTVKGCYFDTCNPTKCNFIYPNFVDTMVEPLRGQSPNANRDTLPNGVDVIIEDNVFNDITVTPSETSNNYIIRLTGGSAKVEKLVNFSLKDNIFKAKSATSAVAVSPAGGGSFNSAVMSGNKFYNFTKPLSLWQDASHLTEQDAFICNIDENYYAMIVDGKPVVTPITWKDTDCVEKSDWYYMDEAMTVKDTDFVLDLSNISGNAEFATIGKWTVTGAMKCGVEYFTPSDILPSGSASVLGIYSDAACQNALTGNITATNFYIKVKVGDAETVFAATFTKQGAHSFGDYQTVTEVGCETDGLEERTCSNCGATEQRTVKSTGHVPGPLEPHQATCTENAGVYSVCARCGEVLEGTEIPDTALGHDWGEEKVLVEGSCTVDRVIEHTCARCTETEQVTTTAPGHEFGAWRLVKEPSCEETGLQRRTCLNCPTNEDVTITALGHQYESVTELPTCVKAGRSYEICIICNTVKPGSEQTLPATGIHQWGEEFTNAPTCISAGSKQRFCVDCGKFDESAYEFIPADPTAHAYAEDDLEVIREGNCLASKLSHHFCLYCQKEEIIEDKSMVKDRHDFATVTTPSTFNQSGKVEYICKNCGETKFVKILPRLPRFKDVKTTDWYFEALQIVAAKGIIAGYDDGTFRPNANITRAETVSMFARMAGINTKKYSTVKFADVKKGAWYNGAVAWAEQNGIVSGRSESEFAPDKFITRQEFVTLIVRYAKYAKVTLPTTTAKVKFADDKKIASFAKNNVYICQRAGIIGGKPGNLFDPNGNTTRAEACKMFATFIAITPAE